MSDPIIKAPIYFQTTDRLRRMIDSGTFPEGARFLTERQVAERFAISRATANKALASLVAEGRLEFRKGIGTFVRNPEPPLDYDLRALVSFTEKARAAGKTPATRVLRLETMPAAAELAERLQVTVGTPLWAMDRLRLADGLPVILERRHLPVDRCPGLTAERVSGSLYQLLTVTCGLDVIGAEETIQAVNVVGEDAELLAVPEGAAGLRVIATALLAGGIPLWHERTLYRGDAYAFRNWLGPIRPAGSMSAIGELR
jgi:GntR family transcriptional regulator